MLRHSLPLILFLSVSFLLSGQDAPSLKGRIVDDKTGAPIPFATIKFLKNNQTISGVVSNSHGDFQIPDKFKAAIDMTVISCIGYKTQQVSISQWRTNQVLIIRLKESSTVLSTVTVIQNRKRRITPEEIIERAIERIPDNYPDEPNAYMAYYRDYQIKDDNYINLNEAIVGVYDQGFGKNDQLTTKVRLFDYEANSDFPRDSSTAIVYDNSAGNKFIPGATLHGLGGNELSVLRIHDAIRNHDSFSFSFINTFDENFIGNHFFKLQGTVYKNDIPLYHISFNSKKYLTGFDHFSNGDIYIEHGTYAIHKLEYSTYKREKWNGKLLYKILIEYETGNAAMHLNYISFNDLFMIKNPADFKVVGILLDRPRNAFVVEFNHKLDLASALDKKSYSFYFNSKPLEVDRIEIQNKQETMICAYLKENNIPNVDPRKLGEKLDATFKGIKDVDGRDINKVTYLPVNQFRELFVQKRMTSIDSNATVFVNKGIPLQKNEKAKDLSDEISGYWMNSPLKKE